MLTIAYNMQATGYVFGILINVLFSVVTIIGYKMLQASAEHTDRYTYDSVSEALFSKGVGKLIQAVCVVVCIGALVAYAIILRDNFFFFDASEKLYTNILLTGIMLVVILPICFLPFLEHLKFNSYLVIGVVAYIIFLTVYTFFTKLSKQELAVV